jgi:hypothetical protein
MDEAQLKEALEHDEARKAQESPASPLPDGPPVAAEMIPLAVALRQLEDKQVFLAKSAAVGFLEAAEIFRQLALAPSETRPFTTKEGKQMVETKPPKPDVADRFMGLSKRALDLAREADLLGDRVVARAPTEEAKHESVVA